MVNLFKIFVFVFYRIHSLKFSSLFLFHSNCNKEQSRQLGSKQCADDNVPYSRCAISCKNIQNLRRLEGKISEQMREMLMNQKRFSKEF